MAETQLQGVAHEISEEARKALQRARKILDLASRPPDESDSPGVRAAKEAEKANAAERYQAVLLEYNLSQAQVDQTGSEAEGRREEAKLKAGVYEWQRNLWEAVAELNFCLYYCGYTYTRQRVRRKDPWDGSIYYTEGTKTGRQHEVIGRAVNTQATINLCMYIEAAIEQATREKLAEVVGSSEKAAITRMLFSRFACDFREGAADDVVGRINEQRAETLREERELARAAAERAAEAAASGISNSTALTLATYTRNEKDLNRDFERGVEPGTTTRERAERAAREAEAERRYTEWAAANPEEAAAKAAEQRAEDERYWARRNANYRGGPAPKERDWRAYKQGSAAGSKIGLDIQAGARKTKGALS